MSTSNKSTDIPMERRICLVGGSIPRSHINSWIDSLESALPEMIVTGDEAYSLASPDAITGVVGNFDSDLISSLDNLRWIHLSTTGTESYDHLPGVINGQIKLMTTQGLYREPVAETVLGSILAHTRQLLPLRDLQTTKTWSSSNVRQRCVRLSDLRILILGRGHLGTAISQRLELLGAPNAALGRDEIHRRAELVARTHNADILICCLPSTPDTVGLLDSELIDALGEQGGLINVGRGSLVDEQHLVKSLKTGRLGWAMLDVTGEEPLPESSPLWSVNNLQLTQHTAGGYATEWDDKLALVMRRLVGTSLPLTGENSRRTKFNGG